MPIESEDINSIHTAYHEAGHHLVFSKLGFDINYTIMKGKNDCSTGYVELKENDIYSLEVYPDYIVGCLAGVEAIKLANAKYDLGLSDREMERGGTTDLEHTMKARMYSDLSIPAAKSKARSLLITHWSEVDAFATRLFRKRKVYG